MEEGSIDLGNIGFGDVASFLRRDVGGMPQWVVPAGLANTARGSDGLPPMHVVEAILKAAEEFAPDLVHVWGAETFWGLLSARGHLKPLALLEMQGLKSAIARDFFGGLNLWQRARCTGLREILRRQTMSAARGTFLEWVPREREMIRGHRYVTTQSDWMEQQVRAVSDGAEISRTELILRPEFYAGGKWSNLGGARIFCSAAYAAPFKGLHVAIRALARLKQRIPEVQLRIAGPRPTAGVRRDGYLAWVDGEARRLRVHDRVVWLGPIEANRIVEELQTCSAMVVPSFVESYCLAMAEAMLIGVPCVAAFTGGTTHLAIDGQSALFFAPNDDSWCATQLERTLTSPSLASSLSDRAYLTARQRHDPERIAARQAQLYRTLIARAQTRSDGVLRIELGLARAGEGQSPSRAG